MSIIQILMLMGLSTSGVIFLALIITGIFWVFQLRSLKKKIPESVKKEVEKQNAETIEKVRRYKEALEFEPESDSYNISTGYKKIDLFNPARKEELRRNKQSEKIGNEISGDDPGVEGIESGESGISDEDLREQRIGGRDRTEEIGDLGIGSEGINEERGRLQNLSDKQFRKDKQKFKLHRPSDI